MTRARVREGIFRALRAYCAQDTLAMVELRKVLARRAATWSIGQHRDRSITSSRWLYSCHLYAIFHAMKTTIDAAGRIVVPKPLREALGLKPGQPLELRAGDGRLEIEIVPTPVRLKKRGKGLVAVPDVELPALSAELVRETLERVRR
jgi:AbrB family looped-hinge helix DNA binding protein